MLVKKLLGALGGMCPRICPCLEPVRTAPRTG